MRIITGLIFLFALNTIVHGQNQVAKIKFELAEVEYANGQYANALDLINEAEGIVGSSTTRTLYLKVLTQYELVKLKTGGYDMLQSLRENCGSYLKVADGDSDLEDKYREIYFISEDLKNYPNNKSEYDLAIEKERVKKELLAKKEQEEMAALKKQQEIEKQRIIDEKLRLEKIENSKIDYFSFQIGLVLPTNKTSKSSVSYSEWSGTGLSVYNYALSEGEMGLSKGLTFGFNGINGFDKINQNLASQNKKFGFGVEIDFSQTFQFYSFKNSTDFPSNNSWYVEDIKSKPYSITSVGIGPSITFILNSPKSFLDLYGRADFNLFAWGTYEASTSQYDADFGATFDATSKGYRDENETSTFGFSPTIGMSYRKNQFYLGAELRMKVIEKNASFTDDLTYGYSGFNQNTEKYIYSVDKGLDFSYFAIKIGRII